MNSNRRGGSGSANSGRPNNNAQDRRAADGAKRRRQPSPRRTERVGQGYFGDRFHNSRGRRVSSFRRADAPEATSAAKTEAAKVKYRYMVLWKPCGVAVRFGDAAAAAQSESTRLEYYVKVPKLMPVGQLDADTEGLMLLTDDPRFRIAVGQPRSGELRIFLAQVEGVPQQEALDMLQKGVILNDVAAEPVEAELIPAPKLPSRTVPIRERKNVPDSWVELRATEGWSRHVRRLTASMGHPTLRLVVWSVGPVNLTAMVPGQCRELTVEEKRWVENVLERFAARPVKPRRLRPQGGRRTSERSRSAGSVTFERRGAQGSHWACRVGRAEAERRGKPSRLSESQAKARAAKIGKNTGKPGAPAPSAKKSAPLQRKPGWAVPKKKPNRRGR